MIGIPRTIIAGFLVGLLAGCGSAPKTIEQADLARGPLPVVSKGEYKIQIGDELTIKFFYNRDLNEDVIVRPDGRISLQLIPEVTAAGITPAELTSQLKSLYATQMDKPEIAVIVRTFSSQRIYVDGEVGRPGELALVGPTTIIQAIARAGGTTDRARVKDVILVRRGPSGEPVVMRVNLKDARQGAAPSHDLVLVPYDVVFVPKTAIANVNTWVDQYLRQNIPFSFGFRVEIDF